MKKVLKIAIILIVLLVTQLNINKVLAMNPSEIHSQGPSNLATMENLTIFVGGKKVEKGEGLASNYYVSGTTFQYNGKKIEPSVEVYKLGTTKIDNSNYELTYGGDYSTGKGWVKIKAKSDSSVLKGSITINFDVEGYKKPNGTIGGNSAILGGDDVNEYDPSKYEEKNPNLNDKVGTILLIIRAVGTVVSVISLMVIGIKTMFSSVEEKAAYKQSLPGYVVGAIMVLAISAIPQIIYNLVKSL